MGAFVRYGTRQNTAFSHPGEVPVPDLIWYRNPGGVIMRILVFQHNVQPIGCSLPSYKKSLTVKLIQIDYARPLSIRHGNKDDSMHYKYLIILIPFLFGPAAYGDDEPGTLKECQKIKDRIDRYTNLRRYGGTSRQMDQWQKKRNYYKDKYTEKDCTQHRNHLK